MWQALPEGSAGSGAWWYLPGFGVPPVTKTTAARWFVTRDPSRDAKTFAQILARACKLEWVGRYYPSSLFALGVVDFH